MSEKTYITEDPALYDFVLAGVQIEASLLSQNAADGYLNNHLPHLENYRNFLTNDKDSIYAEGLYKTLQDKMGFIAANDNNKTLKDIYACANIAAACAVFQNWTLPIQMLNDQNLQALVRESVQSFHNNDPEKATLLADRINGADTVRVIQTLKLFGLLPIDTASCHQLSLGAARGVRDIFYLHSLPSIKHYTPHIFEMSAENTERISLDLETNKAQDIVLVDNHPAYSGYYETISKKWGERTIGVHKDSSDALKNFWKNETTKHLEPRDLVVMFRIDHEGIPDVEKFLSLVGNVIADEADLIVTIGAGHSLAEFEGRLKKMTQISSALKQRGLSPVRFKWYKGNSSQEKVQNPLFGMHATTSYEIIYCKLVKSRLGNPGK